MRAIPRTRGELWGLIRRGSQKLNCGQGSFITQPAVKQAAKIIMRYHLGWEIDALHAPGAERLTMNVGVAPYKRPWISA